MLRRCGVHIRRYLTAFESARILGVSQDATKKDIKEAYLNKAKLYHPDNQVSGDPTKFRQLSIAQDVLERQDKLKHGIGKNPNINMYRAQYQQKNAPPSHPFSSRGERFSEEKAYRERQAFREAAFRNRREHANRKQEYDRAYHRPPQPDHDDFEDYIRHGNAGRRKNVHSEVGAFLNIIFLSFCMAVMVTTIIRIEDMKIIQRAMGMVALQKNIPRFVVIEEYRNVFALRRANRRYKLKYLSEDDIAYIDSFMDHCSSPKSFCDLISTL